MTDVFDAARQDANDGFAKGHPLPERYRYPLQSAFVAEVQPALTEGVRILDVGSGREPTIPPRRRPRSSWYVGLDVSADELAEAPVGSFDETVVADASDYVPRLDGRFDLIVSWQALEHVERLDGAVANLHGYLRPGGLLIAQLSGRFASFALLSRMVPHRLSVLAMQRLIGSDPNTKFVTHYHLCYHRALARLFRPWSHVEIAPAYLGASYLGFLRPLQQLYLYYENAVCHRRLLNLATHYLIVATK